MQSWLFFCMSPPQRGAWLGVAGAPPLSVLPVDSVAARNPAQAFAWTGFPIPLNPLPTVRGFFFKLLHSVCEPIELCAIGIDSASFPAVCLPARLISVHCFGNRTEHGAHLPKLALAIIEAALDDLREYLLNGRAGCGVQMDG